MSLVIMSLEAYNAIAVLFLFTNPFANSFDTMPTPSLTADNLDPDDVDDDNNNDIDTNGSNDNYNDDIINNAAAIIINIATIIITVASKSSLDTFLITSLLRSPSSLILRHQQNYNYFPF